MKRLLAALLIASWSVAAPAQLPPKPGARDLCPVCGMLVSKYPSWAATIVWKDGHVHHFDGAKDMFRFFHDLPKYAPDHKREDLAGLWVTDFYSLQRVDARKAYYVTGSDVLGPMGHELVPLASRADAEEFLKDHQGKRVLGFDEVSARVAAGLDAGKF